MELPTCKEPAPANYTENRTLSFKWRLQRIHSSLRSSFHSKKRNSTVKRRTGKDSREVPGQRQGSRLQSGCEISQKFSHFDSLKPRQEYLSQNKQHLSNSEGSKHCLFTLNGNLPREKTIFDGGSLDKRKAEDSKLWSNNKVICNANGDTSFQEQMSDKRTADEQITAENSKRRRQKSSHRKENNNKQAPIARTKSLNKLVSLFKRSGNSDKRKNKRGKKLLGANSVVLLSNTLSSTASANLESHRTAASTSTLDSFSDSDCYLDKDYKYRSLRRSRASLVYPAKLQRSFSLDNSLAPFDDNMGEKSGTLTELTPSIHVQEFGERGNGSSFELHRGSSGSISVDVRRGTEAATADSHAAARNSKFTDHVGCSSSQLNTKLADLGADCKCDIYACGHRRVESDIGAELGEFVVTSESASQTDFVDREWNYSDCTMGSSTSGASRLRRLLYAKDVNAGNLGDNELEWSRFSESVDGSPIRERRERGFRNDYEAHIGYCVNCRRISRENPPWQQRERKCGVVMESIIVQPNGFRNQDGTLFFKETTADECRGDSRPRCVNISERAYSKCCLKEQTALSATHSDFDHSVSCLRRGQDQLQSCGCHRCTKFASADECGENASDVSGNCCKAADAVAMEKPVAMETGNGHYPNNPNPGCSCNTAQQLNQSMGSDERLFERSYANGRDGVWHYCRCCGQAIFETSTPVHLLSSSPRTPIRSPATLQVLPAKQRSTSALTPKTLPPSHTSFLEENRSCSCTQLNRRANSASTSPPQVRPRIQSLEELSADATQVVMRKKRSFMEKTKVKHATSLDLPSMGETLTDKFYQSKRHSYGGACDTLSIPFSFQRSHSTEGCLENCTDSTLSIDTPNSSLYSSSIFSSILSLPASAFGFDSFDVSLGRSRSVPGFFGVSDIPQTSPIPEERERFASVGSMQSSGSSVGLPTYPMPLGDDSLEEYEMDAPEAFAEALWDHVTMDPEELSFKAGDIITVISMTSCDWWYGQVHDRVGWFPAPFVRVRVSQTLAGEETKLAPPVRTRKGTNEGFLSDDAVRSRVVDEILNTERDYVKNLQDVVEGYLEQARIRTDMFTDEQIAAVFSNIEQLYTFHKQLLEQLEECYVLQDPKASLIGSVFLTNKGGFEIYSEYCNNHPHAIVELKMLCERDQYKHFFEACRLLREMISIPLDGFLLTPVQKICKYPLQLAELLKHTIPNHKDYQSVREALQTMKEVASLINERKRKVECVNKIAKWQSTIEGWEGENVLLSSSELIHSGDAVKISKGTSQERVMFLFDHQLIYCKKDLLKKNHLTYKGRIDTDLCRVTWLKDDEENHNGSPLTNAWKMYEPLNDKYYIMYTKKPEQREKWRQAFAEEKRRVREDARTGLIITQKTRLAAMRAAQCSLKNKKLNLKKDKILKSQSSSEIRPPPSPTLRLPAAVSSADLKEENELGLNKENGGLLQRGGVIRRSFGLRGSKKNKEKRMSSVF